MQNTRASNGLYRRQEDDIFTPAVEIRHRDEQYDPSGFDTLLAMQRRHFWYQGRHRFLLAALERERRQWPAAELPAAVDLGGGCGGWLDYLRRRQGDRFRELALADSSRQALQQAAPVVGPSVARYQVDLLDLGWQERWDVAFLLDVLAVIPDDVGVLRQVAKALRPGGLLLVTSAALQFFWSYHDDLARHQRRYSRDDLARLAALSGLELRWSRYFMFLLSPLLLASRWRRPRLESMSEQAVREHMRRTHRVPPPPLNRLLTLAFACETPLGLRLPFPWGASVLGVFRKPAGRKSP